MTVGLGRVLLGQQSFYNKHIPNTMKRVIVSIIILLCSAHYGMSQNYTSDASLVRAADNYAVLECSGIGDNNKDAIEMAKKSCIYTYLFNGITGLNNNRPLLGIKPTKEAVDYVNNKILGTSTYANYIRSCTVGKDVNKTASKQKQVLATIELYHVSLERTLVNAGVLDRKAADIAIADAQEMIAMPTIMVVPYKRDGENYKDVLEANPDVQMAIAKINEAFISEGVETKDIVTGINNADLYMARSGGNMSLDDMILVNSGADVSVSVRVVKNENPQGMQVSLILQAVEISTGNTLASKSETSARKRATAEAICAPMAKYMVGQGGFMKQIQTRISSKISTGQSIAVNFTIDPGAAITMDTEINNILPLSDILVTWIKRHAKGGRYHSQGRTETMLAFSDIYIDNSVEDGVQNDINDFSIALYKYLRGLDLSITRTVIGNRVEIVIQ